MVQLGFCHSAALAYEDELQPILMMFVYVRVSPLSFSRLQPERAYLHKLKYILLRFWEPVNRADPVQAEAFFGRLADVVLIIRHIVYNFIGALRASQFQGKPVSLGAEFLKGVNNPSLALTDPLVLPTNYQELFRSTPEQNFLQHVHRSEHPASLNEDDPSEYSKVKLLIRIGRFLS